MAEDINKPTQNNTQTEIAQTGILPTNLQDEMKMLRRKLFWDSNETSIGEIKISHIEYDIKVVTAMLHNVFHCPIKIPCRLSCNVNDKSCPNSLKRHTLIEEFKIPFTNNIVLTVHALVASGII